MSGHQYLQVRSHSGEPVDTPHFAFLKGLYAFKDSRMFLNDAHPWLPAGFVYYLRRQLGWLQFPTPQITQWLPR